MLSVLKKFFYQQCTNFKKKPLAKKKKQNYKINVENVNVEIMTET